MENEQFNRFIYRPIWQQQGILIVISLLSILGGYYWLLKPINDNDNQQRQIYISTLTDIEQITEKITQYADEEDLLAKTEQLQSDLAIIKGLFLPPKKFEERLSSLILNSQLQLLHFQYHQNDTTAQSIWQVDLQGDYLPFIEFMQSISDNDMQFNIINLLINKNKNILIFSLIVSNQIEE